LKTKGTGLILVTTGIISIPRVTFAHNVIWRQRRKWEEKNAKHLTPLWRVSLVAYAK